MLRMVDRPQKSTHQMEKEKAFIPFKIYVPFFLHASLNFSPVQTTIRIKKSLKNFIKYFFCGKYFHFKIMLTPVCRVGSAGL